MPAVTHTHSVLDEKKELMKTFFTRQLSFLGLALLSDCRLSILALIQNSYITAYVCHSFMF